MGTLLRTLLFNAMPLGFMALSVFFFLAPGYENLGLICAALSLVVHGLRLWQISRLALLKQILLLALSICIYLVSRITLDAALQRHLYELAMGIFIALAAYRAAQVGNLPMRYVLAALALPFVVHLVFFLPQIPKHLFYTDGYVIARFESLRTSVQIGSKLLGHALILLLPLLYYLLCILERKSERLLGWLSFCMACVCLALLDSRAAYVSLFVGVLFAIYTKRTMIKRLMHSGSYGAKMDRIVRIQRTVVIVAVVCGIVAMAVGWNRLSRMDAAVHAAIHRADHTSWITPATWMEEFCFAKEKRCLVEASAYLRLSWILFGLEKIAEHPWRIKPSLTPLEQELKRSYPDVASRHPIYTDFHSGLMDAAINYGIMGAASILALLFYPAWLLLRHTRDGTAPDYLPLLACWWGIVITRVIIDSVGVSLWCVAWAYGGFIMALMYDRRHVARHAI